MTNDLAESPDPREATPAVASGSAPVTPSGRIDSLDTLRGFALLGILIINIQWFSMVGAAVFNPTAYGDLTGANFLIWLTSHALGELKFMAIFSMLFGAGIVLMSERLAARGGPVAGIHYRRMGWLIVFGLMHAHLLWYGDILYAYGMCGLVVFLFRRLRPVPLLVLGLFVLAVAGGLFLMFGLSMSLWPPEDVADLAADFSPSAKQIGEELAIYRGGWLQQMTHRVPEALGLETFVFLIFFSWRAGGLMLIGMGLHKLGVFAAQRSRVFYLALFGGGMSIGLPLILYGVQRNFAAGWDVHYSFFLGPQFNYWGSVPVALGWVGLVMLVCISPAARRWTSPLTAVGRMALTNYLMQTILCTTIFYGHGLGLYGHVERTGQVAIVLAIWVFQLIVSPWWLRRFRFGPAEWLWRTLTYLRPQPMRVHAS